MITEKLPPCEPIPGSSLTASELRGHLDQIESEGYTILYNIIDPDLLKDLRNAWKELTQRHNIGSRNTRFEGARTLRLYNPLAYHPVFQQVPIQPEVLNTMQCVLGEELILSSLTVISPQPGERAQRLHADDDLIPIRRPHPPLVANSIWALQDFTENNGATIVVPGTHYHPELPDENKTYETKSVTMPAGSVLIFNGSLWHGAGANTSDQPRDALACYYSRGFLRAEENPFLGIPIEVARTFPRRLAELCGYSRYKDLYGHIEKRDPIELLGHESVKTMVWDEEKLPKPGAPGSPHRERADAPLIPK